MHVPAVGRTQFVYNLDLCDAYDAFWSHSSNTVAFLQNMPLVASWTALALPFYCIYSTPYTSTPSSPSFFLTLCPQFLFFFTKNAAMSHVEVKPAKEWKLSDCAPSNQLDLQSWIPARSSTSLHDRHFPVQNGPKPPLSPIRPVASSFILQLVPEASRSIFLPIITSSSQAARDKNQKDTRQKVGWGEREREGEEREREREGGRGTCDCR
jgi:hypothetical protein